MNTLSGLIITLNEEKHIADCIDSLKRICDDVVVVDSLSDDRTAEIATEHGATVVKQAFLGDGPQRNAGLAYCKHDWVICIDADERLDDDLVNELQGLNPGEGGVEAYEMRRKNFLHDQWIRVAGQYPDYICRLFNKTATRMSEDYTHTRITTQKLGRLSGHFLHYSFDNYANMLDKLNLYSDYQSQTLFERGKKVSRFAPFLHGLYAFIKFYFLRRGFVAGLDGLTLSMLNAMGSYFKYAKLIEKQRSVEQTNP